MKRSAIVCLLITIAFEIDDLEASEGLQILDLLETCRGMHARGLQREEGG